MSLVIVSAIVQVISRSNLRIETYSSENLQPEIRVSLAVSKMYGRAEGMDRQSYTNGCSHVSDCGSRIGNGLFDLRISPRLATVGEREWSQRKSS